MSTAVLSVDSAATGREVLSWILFGLALIAEVVLGVALVSRLLADRSGWLADAATPASLTGVAATTVIGSRFASLGWIVPAWMSLGASLLLWLVLLPLVLRHWQLPGVGVAFLVCVATEGLSILMGDLGITAGSRLLVGAGFVFLALGLGLYAVVLRGFDWRQLVVGAGDQWVVAGALAISSLAAATLLAANARLHVLVDLQRPLEIADLVIWAVALAGCAVLLCTELRWPRWRYDKRRWATVFPIGMAAAASLAVGQVEQLRTISEVGQVILWPGLAAWTLTAIGAVRTRLRRGDLNL